MSDIGFTSGKIMTPAEVKAYVKPVHEQSGHTINGYEYSYKVYFVKSNNGAMWAGKFTGDDTQLGNFIKWQDGESMQDYFHEGNITGMGHQLLAVIQQTSADVFRQHEKLVKGKFPPQHPPLVQVPQQDGTKDLEAVADHDTTDYIPHFVEHVEKTWGEELIFHSTDQFCIKHLVFEKKGNYCSLHFHKKKYEEWTVLRGSFAIEFMKPVKGQYNLIKQPITKQVYNVGEVVKIEQKLAHRMTALEDNSVLLEVSTSDLDDDNVRLIPSMEKRV